MIGVDGTCQVQAPRLRLLLPLPLTHPANVDSNAEKPPN